MEYLTSILSNFYTDMSQRTFYRQEDEKYDPHIYNAPKAAPDWVPRQNPRSSSLQHLPGTDHTINATNATSYGNGAMPLPSRAPLHLMRGRDSRVTEYDRNYNMAPYVHESCLDSAELNAAVLDQRRADLAQARAEAEQRAQAEAMLRRMGTTRTV
jgi:hypothetical protein